MSTPETFEPFGAPWEMPFGAAYAPDGTRFRLFAPAASAVTLEFEDGTRAEMTAHDRGWFLAHHQVRPGTGYRFRMPDGPPFPDPASRAQKGGVHGYSMVVDPAAYEWRHRDWRGRPWHEAVIYEVNAGVLGGFEALRARLPDLARLGITALELMPLADFPGTRGWGYDGVLPFAPAGAYGPPDALKALIDEAHGLGMMVLLDAVYNHFGPDGNYLHLYAPDFFDESVHTPWGAAIAFGHPVVADFFLQNALYWLNEYRFDGLRLDAVHAIAPPEALPALITAIRAGVEGDRFVHLTIENEHNDASILATQAADAQWNDDFHHCVHVLLTDEDEGYYRDFTQDAAAKLARCLAEGFAFQGDASHTLGRARGTASAHLPPTAFVDCIQNHDQIGNRAMGERLLALADPAKVRAAAALLLLSPHIPMIFMGEEIGSRSPFLYFTDHTPALAEAVREGRRNEFRHFAGFHDEARRAAIPDPNAPETFEASYPHPGEDGFNWRSFYEGLLAVRAQRIIPGLPGAKTLRARALSDKAVVASWQLGTGETLHLAANFGDAPLELALPRGEIIAATFEDARDTLPPGATLGVLSPAETMETPA